MEPREQVDRFELVNQIFSDALNIPASRRPEFVRKRCKSDPQLGASVLRLLSRFDGLGDFLEDPAFETPSSASQELRTGDLLCDRFRIIERIGGGGMGDVYRAEDLLLSDLVALKTIRVAWRENKSIESRFCDEIRLARKISHRNICKIYDLFTGVVGNARKLVFFTMEYLDGDTLKERLSEGGPFTQAATLAIADQIAQGLDAAHNAGIVHRDLKPANILIVSDRHGAERVVITDFGLAKTFEADPVHPQHTQAGQILGSPDYMAPEQFDGSEVSPATDIFAFGIILFEMIAGRRPYPSENIVRAAVRRLTDEPERLRQSAPEAPASWEWIVEKTLSRKPQERYQSASEIIRDLGVPTPPQASRKIGRPKFSRRALISGGLGALPMAGLFALLRFRYWRPVLPASTMIMLNPMTHYGGEAIEPEALDLILRNQLVQSSRVQILSRDQVEKAWRTITANGQGTPAPRSLEPHMAREIALREGAQIVAFGEMSRVADRRVLLLQLELMGGTPDHPRKSWLNKFDMGRPSDLPAIGHEVASWIRRTVGESATELNGRNRPPEDLTTPSWEAFQEFVQANEAFHSGQTDAALLHLKAALRVDPHFALAAARMADILLSAGRKDEGFEYWSKAATLLGDRNLTDKESLGIRGLFAIDTGQNEEAEQVFSRYALEYPNDGLPLFYKASAVERMGRNEEALRLLTLAMERKPLYSFVMARAVHHLGQGRLAEAQRDWESGKRMNSTDWTDQIHAGIAFAHADFPAVWQSLGRMKASGSPVFQSRAFALQACLYAEHRNWPAAEQALTDGVAFDRTMGLAPTARHEKQILLAQVFVGMGRLGQATQVCTDALRDSPGHVVRMQFGCVLARIGDISRAATCVVEGLPPWPIYQFWVWRLQGEIALARKDFRAGLVSMQRAVQPPSMRICPDFLVHAALAAEDYATAGDTLRQIFRSPGLYWIEAERNTAGFVRNALETVQHVNRWPDLLERLAFFDGLFHNADSPETRRTQ